MKKRKMLYSRIVEINSRSRTTGSDSNFTYEIKDDTKKYDRVTVLQASLPKSYYLIQSNYNTFELKEDSKTTTVTVTPGNYSSTVFASTLTTLLTAASPNSLVYTVTSPALSRTVNTGKYTFAARTSVGGIPSQTISLIVGTNMYEQLGFSKNSTNTFTSGNLTSTNVINMQAEQTLFVHSNMCYNNGGGQNDVLIEVFAAETPDFGRIVFKNPQAYYWSRAININSSGIYTFTLTDDEGTIMDLNGLNINIVLLMFKEDKFVSDLSKITLQEMAKGE